MRAACQVDAWEALYDDKGQTAMVVQDWGIWSTEGIQKFFIAKSICMHELCMQ